ncbi:hypothetical protein EHS25_009190 [Saitozyma podzolica]|uniref:Sfi1 spindle body domain-containing protein n=1 Tax=Saitozyma podzolica TaxID=1890683 RepID=A0A427YL71_9TREE|nr:hypothetical protein EHS25_009190 [Saitozyma podzolica]
MLAASSLSAISRASSSLTEAVDLDLIEEIIDRAPRAATTFPQVHRAYIEVLEEHDIPQARDTAYYQFLLKLGVIRAATWGERWDLWRTTHLSMSAFGAPRHVHAASSPKVPLSSKLAEVKRRVPFLASASSDLDEAYDRTYDGDAESLVLSPARASPRKVLEHERSRSLVGYTPVSSFDLDSLALDAPVRTSTPVFGRSTHVPAQTPPPYSVSDVSDSLELDDEDSQLIEGLKTPRPLVRLDVEDLDPAVLAELEKRADEFYHTGLVGRCWDVWVQANDWVRKTTHQIDTVRSAILLRQTLAKWQAVHERHLSLPNTADAHRTHHLQSLVLRRWIRRARDLDLERKEGTWVQNRDDQAVTRSWRKWRGVTVRRRTEKWATWLREREAEFAVTREERAMASVFQRWREAAKCRTNERIADELLERKDLCRALDMWLKRTRLNQTLEAYEQDKAEIELSEAFSHWRRMANVGPLERELESVVDARVVMTAWGHWKRICDLRVRANELYATRVLRENFSRWRDSMTRLRVMQRRGAVFAQQRDKNLVGKCFGIWKRMERGQLLHKVQEQRLLSHVFVKWRGSHEILSRLQNVADDVYGNAARTRLHQAFSRWRASCGARQTSLLQAELVHEQSIVGRTLKAWVAKSRRSRQDEVTADKARVFFVQRQVVRCWHVALAGRRQAEAVERRRLLDLGRVFNQWQIATVRSIEDRLAVRSFQGTQAKRLLGRALAQWTERVIEVKSREIDVVETRDSSLSRDALRRWVSASRRVADAKSLMTSFMEDKEEQSLRSILRHWRDRSREAKRHREMLRDALLKRDERLQSQALEAWKDKLREKQLALVEQEVALRHEDAVMFSAWDRWKARVPNLPGITADQMRLKKLAWGRWRAAADGARRARVLAQRRDRELLDDVFGAWRKAYEVKAASRATRTRGRLRPSSGIPASTTNVNPARDPSAVVAIRRTPASITARPRSSSQHRPSPLFLTAR